MQGTKIEYLDMTWNPIAMRCTPVSEGCRGCWHLRYCDRHASNPKFGEKRRMAYSGAQVILSMEELAKPSARKKPAIIGVQFMGDLGHEKIPEIFLEAIFRKIHEAKQHTFLTLTKRPERLFDWMSLANDPLPNLWLGVSVENQCTADERIPILLQIPAARRFVSVEPMLEEIDLRLDENGRHPDYDWGIDLIICGPETGPRKRPFDVVWARSLRDQCAEAGTPFFYKAGELDGKLHHEWPEVGA